MPIKMFVKIEEGFHLVIPFFHVLEWNLCALNLAHRPIWLFSFHESTFINIFSFPPVSMASTVQQFFSKMGYLYFASNRRVLRPTGIAENKVTKEEWKEEDIPQESVSERIPRVNESNSASLTVIIIIFIPFRFINCYRLDLPSLLPFTTTPPGIHPLK